MKLTISVITGFDEGKKEQFDDFPISIGRLDDNDFQLSGPCVSRRHCTILYNDNTFLISDLKSTNGTILNENSITTTCILSDEDKLIIGENYLKINFK
jgi:pilus assembly protein CpaF